MERFEGLVLLSFFGCIGLRERVGVGQVLLDIFDRAIGGDRSGVDGLQQCGKLPEPIFTPATKAEQGEHDENIPFERACELVGEPLMTTLRDLTLSVYGFAHDYAAQRGIILADTKFEFGLPIDGGPGAVPILIDEVLTPDSSRFWSASAYEAGRDQDSYDKQYVRNYLESLVSAGQWDKQAPGQVLPEDVLANTIKKYEEAFEMITGVTLH